MAHLIFLTSTPPNVAAGSGTWVGISVLRKALVAQGHNVTLVAPTERSGAKTTLDRLVFNLRAGRSIREAARADVLIGFDLDGAFLRGGEMYHVAAIKGVLADEAVYEKGPRRMALQVQALLEARHVRRADRVITTSVYSSERIARAYGLRAAEIAVVPEMIDLSAWQHALESAAIVEGPPRILCVAHLYLRKRVCTLLRAFARVRSRALLRIVGTGPEKARLENLAHDLGLDDRVEFLGCLPLGQLTAEYRNATMFALPTAQEGFGIVFLEAMASSLPVIAGRSGAVPEVVVEGETALLVDPDDDAELARLMERLLDDRGTRQSLGAAGHEHVRRYDAAVVARQFLAAVGRPTP